jgi:hypothetical protein
VEGARRHGSPRPRQQEELRLIDLPRSPGGLVRADAQCRVPGFDHVAVVGDFGAVSTARAFERHCLRRYRQGTAGHEANIGPPELDAHQQWARDIDFRYRNAIKAPPGDTLMEVLLRRVRFHPRSTEGAAIAADQGAGNS